LGEYSDSAGSGFFKHPTYDDDNKLKVADGYVATPEQTKFYQTHYLEGALMGH
jgi:hypothetical protein